MSQESQDIQSLFDNITNHKCVICGLPTESTLYLCLKCNKPCDVSHDAPIPIPRIEGQFIMMDIKSACCNYDVKILSRTTCSSKCHEEFIELMEATCGKHKKIIDAETGISYQVPTRDIIEKGINQKDLYKYPVWSDKTEKKTKTVRIPVE